MCEEVKIAFVRESFAPTIFPHPNCGCVSQNLLQKPMTFVPTIGSTCTRQFLEAPVFKGFDHHGVDITSSTHSRGIRQFIGYLSKRELYLRALAALTGAGIEARKMLQRLRTSRQRPKIFQTNLVCGDLSKKDIRVAPSQGLNRAIVRDVLEEAVAWNSQEPPDCFGKPSRSELLFYPFTSLTVK